MVANRSKQVFANVCSFNRACLSSSFSISYFLCLSLMWVTLLYAVICTFIHAASICQTVWRTFALGRAYKRSRHLRFHPDIVHTRDFVSLWFTAFELFCWLNSPIMEICAAYPHFMKNNGKFTGHSGNSTPMTFCF